MKYGIMNNPANDLYKEIKTFSEMDADFIDLTLEPPKASLEQLDPKTVKNQLKKYNIGITGHTAWFLPFQNGIKEVRDATADYLIKCYYFFQEAGSKNVNFHLMPAEGFFNKEDLVKFYSQVLNETYKKIDNNLNLMIEHTSASQEQFFILDKLFKKFPKLKFHLDIGHANIGTKENATEKFLKKYHKKLEHVHISDNRGEDDHLPVGVGNINWNKIAKLFKKYKYDNTITPEIFSNDRSYWKISRDKFKNYLKNV
ncbi:MAG: sugar phosphate isomerase/epimerase [Nanoarchaeota archaeon]